MPKKKKRPYRKLPPKPAKVPLPKDFTALAGKFLHLTKKEARARLKEIKRLLLAI